MQNSQFRVEEMNHESVQVIGYESGNYKQILEGIKCEEKGTSSENADPVQVASETARHVCLATSRQANHHNH